MLKACPWFYGPLMVGFSLFGFGCSGGMLNAPDGTWSCTAQWTGEESGVPVSITSVVENTCVNGDLTSIGVLSIGDAQWSEEKKGTCKGTEDELYGTWSSLETVTKNQAAKAFEEERFGGQSLGKVAWDGPSPYRVKVLSRTDTRLKLQDPDNRLIACTKL